MTARLCPHCQTPFTPTARGRRGREQATCGRRPCRHIQIGLTRRGQPQYRQRATKREQHNAVIRGRLREAFGKLNKREVELFRHVWMTAYKRGYDVGRRDRLAKGMR